MSRVRPTVAATALAAGVLIVVGAVALCATAATGRFTFSTAAIVAIYLLWPALLLLGAVLSMAAFTLFAAAFFQKLRDLTHHDPGGNPGGDREDTLCGR
ncbi:MAG TPA: hypothetical protein VFM06_06595 [Candidatus Limnocylindria bacterium]|nr:hypothetical protein [Candidatus Limnocylindria bacterium]